MTSPYRVGQGWGAKKAAPRERGSLERAGLTGFVGRDPNPIKNPRGQIRKASPLTQQICNVAVGHCMLLQSGPSHQHLSWILARTSYLGCLLLPLSFVHSALNTDARGRLLQLKSDPVLPAQTPVWLPSHLE